MRGSLKYVEDSEAGMTYRSVAAMLLIALLALPAPGAQKTVLYEHFTSSW